MRQPALKYLLVLCLVALVQACDRIHKPDAKGCVPDGAINTAGYTFLGERGEDYAGYWVSNAGDVDGDGLDDVLVGAYDNDENGSSAGAAYLILGKSLGDNTTTDLSMADYKFMGEDAGDWAGIMVSGAGDVDGDGLDDIVVGAYGVDDKGPITGAAYVILAANLGTSATINLAHADYKFIGESVDDYAGYAVSRAGDVDGDGLVDILIGASGQDAGGNDSGAAYIILGRSLGAIRTMDLSGADYKFIGETSDDWAGYSLSGAGDVDGDGLDDVLIGADGDDGGTEAHASYLILGRSLGASALIDLAQADYKFIGERAYDYASQVSIPGDLDGDKLDDIIVGAAGLDVGGSYAGGAYIILGRSLGEQAIIDLSQADYQLIGENAGDGAGATVAHAGDIDGDGLDDVLIGALRYASQYKNQGAAYLLFGRSLGEEPTINLSQADYKFLGAKADQYVGHAVSGAGDVDGDGLHDVVIGAWAGPSWSGATYIVTGENTTNLLCPPGGSPQ